MTDADDVPVCASCADPMDTSDREYTEDESICDECAQDGYIAALARIKALEVESERKQAAIDELSKEWAMTDAELDIVQLWVDKVGDNNTALEKDLADDVDRLVAEVRRLRSDAAIDSDNMVRFLSRAEQAETELFQAQDSERRAVNALDILRAEVERLRRIAEPTDAEVDEDLRAAGMDPLRVAAEGERIVEVSQRALEQRIRADALQAELELELTHGAKIQECRRRAEAERQSALFAMAQEMEKTRALQADLAEAVVLVRKARPIIDATEAPGWHKDAAAFLARVGK